jgi:hypothetical protein
MAFLSSALTYEAIQMSFSIVNVSLVERMFLMRQRIYFPSGNSYASVVQLLAVCRIFQAEDMDRCVW